jgi:hypothetical protein
MRWYSRHCTCGFGFRIPAESREDAIAKLKEEMDQDALNEHWQQFHDQQGEPKPTLEEAHALIDQQVREANEFGANYGHGDPSHHVVQVPEATR